MAMRLNSLSLQKKFSIKWRHLYISSSSGWERARRGCCEMTILAPRALRSHVDAFELLELAEEVFDQMAPLVHLLVERVGACAPGMLRNDDLGAPRVQVGDDGVAVEGFV